MTASAQIQSLYDKGNGLTGQAIGAPFSHYRPIGLTAAIASGNLLSSMLAWFDQKAQYKLPGNVKSDEWIGYFDGSQTEVGDYLTNGATTYFIAAQQPLLPYLCIACPRVITIYRPSSATSVGQSGYGGNTAATQTTELTAWPASCLQGTKGERGDVTMPDDVKSPWWAFRLPPTPGLVIQSDDIISDDLGRLHSVSSAESTAYGWRLTARQNLG